MMNHENVGLGCGGKQEGVLLTIAIPTFNRPAQLKHTLEVIVPQIAGEQRVRLMVFDNHSEVPAVQILAELGVGLSAQVSVVRHAFNIGGSANVMRCFELCETEWLWVLGDDDKPRPDAVRTILQDAKNEAEHVFAFYSFPQEALPKPIPNGRLAGKTIEALFSAFDYRVMRLALISAGVYRMSAFRRRMAKGYACLSSQIPQLLMVLAEAEAGGCWLLSDKTICDYQQPDRENTFMYYTFFIGLPVAFIAFAQSMNIGRFRRNLQCYYSSRPDCILLYYVVGFQMKELFSLQSGYLFRIMKDVYAPSLLSQPVNWLKWQLVAVASFFPGPFWKTALIACRMLGRPVPSTGVRERTD
ncbi:MAG: glycosyltransferase [bacterium]